MSAPASRVAATCEAIRDGDRRALARTITLLESSREDLAAEGQSLLEALVPYTGGAVRIGITGPPGVGKSSFIEALGLHVIDTGERVAVLAIDPSSPVTGGSILGDKTRMERLARQPSAYIRPSPSGGTLGGVAQRTREAMLVCEAAGYGVVIVETVGIGQSEVAVAGMVDFFLVLLQPGSGDELQGIKKGVLELADGLVVHKADGDLLAIADRSRAQFAGALTLLRPLSASWSPRVLCASSLTGAGIAEVWEMIREQRAALEASGEAAARRRDQTRAWMWSLVDEGLRRAFRQHPKVAGQIEALEREVESLRTTPAHAARTLLATFLER
jgi:LAO/AO transport system kinase